MFRKTLMTYIKSSSTAVQWWKLIEGVLMRPYLSISPLSCDISHSCYFRRVKFSPLSSRLWMKCILLALRRIGIPTSGFVFLSRQSDRCCAQSGWKTDDGLSCPPSGWDQSITPCTAGARLTLKLSTLRESVYCLNHLHTLWRQFVWIEHVYWN